jgi:hypothetical protein
MARITIDIRDPAGVRQQKVLVPDDKPVAQLAQAILQKMGIPAPENGRFILFNKANSQVLNNQRTLGEQGIVDGTVLQFQLDRDAGADPS